jgi:hypothetical protein
VRLLRTTLLVIGMVIALAAWLLLTFDAIYLASFPLSRFGAVLPGTVATVEALWVGVLAYQHRTKRSIHGGDVLAVILVVSICNVIVVGFFSGGL